MATAGSSDVLTGFMMSLVGQGLAPIDAATTGCHVRGLTGASASKRFGQVSMIATDVLNALLEGFNSIGR